MTASIGLARINDCCARPPFTQGTTNGIGVRRYSQDPGHCSQVSLASSPVANLSAYVTFPHHKAQRYDIEGKDLRSSGYYRNADEPVRKFSIAIVASASINVNWANAT